MFVADDQRAVRAAADNAGRIGRVAGRLKVFREFFQVGIAAGQGFGLVLVEQVGERDIGQQVLRIVVVGWTWRIIPIRL